MSYSASRVTTISSSGTPSLSFNNLTACASHLAFSHKDEVYVLSLSAADARGAPAALRVPVAGGAQPFGDLGLVAGAAGVLPPYSSPAPGSGQAGAEAPPTSPSPVRQVAFIVAAGGQAALAVATRAGLGVFGGEGFGTLLHRRHLADCGVPEEAAAAHFARGLAGARTQRAGVSAVLCGTSWGEVLVTTLEGASLSAAVGPSLRGGHRAAVTSVAADERSVVSADDAGVIAQWEPILAPAASAVAAAPAKAIAPVAVLDFGSGFPCTSVALLDDLIVAGYASGHVRIFRQGGGGGGGKPLNRATLEVEFAAHARCLMALALHPSKPTFATVGEDCVLNVWSLPDARAGAPPAGDAAAVPQRCTVLLDMTAPIPDRLLTGVAFSPYMRSTATHVMVAAYDLPALHVFLGL